MLISAVYPLVPAVDLLEQIKKLVCYRIDLAVTQ